MDSNTNHDPSHGLSQAEAARRHAAEGPNEMGAQQSRPLLRILLELAREPMFLLMLGAGAIYFLMGDKHDALLLLGFVVIIMAVTTLQERRTEQALDALRDLSSPRALVLRDGAPQRIPGREVVRGDLLMLTEGDRVPADGKLLEAHELSVDESLLTGESLPVVKAADDRCFAGTLVGSGQGMVLVDAIGAHTELGRIGKSLATIAPEASPLQAEIGALTRRLAVIGIGLCAALTLLFVAIRGGWLEGLLAGITLAMSILPQEFPVTLIVFLALGARRLARQQVLTRHLNAIETLGETSVLCVDKTGTLTQNRMAIATLYAKGQTLDLTGLGPDAALPEDFHELVEFGVLASEIDPRDPMEQAFHRLAGQHLANTEHLHPDWDLVREYELSPQLLAMSHLWSLPGQRHQTAAAKGAPEAIADLCHLSDAQRQQVADEASRMAAQGLRVLGFAKARHDGDESPAIQHDFDFEFLGLAGLADPLRPEVPDAVRECREAGIRLVMITGDHPRTAQAIAEQAGLDARQVVEGAELEKLSPEALAERLSETSVCARISPHQKLRIVEAFKARGQVVAMTGDGVNDAPALKAAHIGIAMGRRGTDVAREAASLVLLEDDFAAIVAAIRQGRRIFANLRQAMIYTLAVHMPIIGLSVLPLLLGMPLLLAPIHIAFLELVIDPACSLVFEAERAAPDLMHRPPRARGVALVGLEHLRLSLVQGVLISLLVTATYALWLHGDATTNTARALAFITLVVGDVMLMLSSRTSMRGLSTALRGLSWTGWSVAAATLAALALVTGVPALGSNFAFAPPDPLAAMAAVVAGIAVLPLLEGAKRMCRQRN
ncbi:MAG TPA: cation-translocating P-type ATPase [Rhodocyclaceae bacterium]|nr:cation-translocating P-type ATPase [Rhodocyclaceae bacterium]